MGLHRYMGYGGSRWNNGAAKAWGDESPKVVVGTKRSRGSRYLGLTGGGFQDKESAKGISISAFSDSHAGTEYQDHVNALLGALPWLELS